MAHSTDGETCDQPSDHSAVIYTITHIETGRVYVGKTYRRDGRVSDRWAEHLNSAKKGSQTYIHSAIRKYGECSFSFKVVDKVSKNKLNEAEIYWIKRLSSNVKGFGFNLTIGGDGGSQSDKSVLKKMSDAARNRKRKPMSNETKEKISMSKIGIQRSPEVIKKIIENRRKYKTLPEEWRKKISEGLRKTAKFKLTDDQKKEVLASKMSSLELSKIYGVHSSTIRRIRRPREYKQHA